MENTRIGKAEAIALILTIMANHAILNITKTIVSTTSSSALLNTIYVSIIALILSYIIYILLNKFPTFDLLDISNFLGGKVLKTIIGILFFIYFVFSSSTLLKNFVFCLQIIYYPNTNGYFITMIFLIAAVFVCNLKYNAIYRSNLLMLPLVVLNIITLFLGCIGDFNFNNIFPIFGQGINETFLIGISNLFAFQGLFHILFLPPHLKDVTELKKITLLSILFSALYLIISIGTILFMFDTTVSKTLLMPLYSAARYIEFGTFFQRLDSVFILTWIISFVCYLGITINTCSIIVKKTTNISFAKFTNIFIILLMLIVTFFSKNYAVSTFLTDVVYKYAFFIMLGISVTILFIACIFRKNNAKKSNYKISSNSLTGGIQ